MSDGQSDIVLYVFTELKLHCCWRPAVDLLGCCLPFLSLPQLATVTFPNTSTLLTDALALMHTIDIFNKICTMYSSSVDADKI